MANRIGTNNNDFLVGTPENDSLLGLDGNDILVGSLGRDIMEGGAGDDRYTVDGEDRSFEVRENPNEGFDVVSSAVTWNLGSNFERLVLTGTGSINGQGNHEDNTIIGNEASNTLRGLQGDDFLLGLAGADILIGDAGDDFLNGGLGNDELKGGTGNDQYFVDSTGDVIVEEFAQGIDLVFSQVNDYILSANLENLFLGLNVISGTGNNLANYIQGNIANNTINGLGGNDFLDGRGGSDFLIGGDGNDKLDGGIGNDTLEGGNGNDQYFVDSVDDTITELTNQGLDTVNSSATTYTLSANLERLVLLEGAGSNEGKGNSEANTITGNTEANTINGDGGNDTLNGGEGDDVLNGDADNDVLNGDVGADILNGGTGNDRLNGEADADSLNGNEGNDFLNGGTGDDILRGGAGIDNLNGGDGSDRLLGDLGVTAGRDAMIGGAGADTFVIGQNGVNFYDDGNAATLGTTEYASIQDFNGGEGDKIQITGSVNNYVFAQAATSVMIASLNGAERDLIGIVLNAQIADVIGSLVFG